MARETVFWKEDLLMRVLIWIVLLITTSIFMSLMSCGSGGKPYRKYVYEGETETKVDEKKPWNEVTIYFSSLDSIRPYVHVFPTGVRTEAPNLDPRDFCPPESLAALFLKGSGRESNALNLISMPDTAYCAIGEIDADLTLVAGSRTYLTPPDGQPPEAVVIDGSMAPNARPYKWFTEPVDWREALDKIRKRAAELGADAVIEVFCGKGISSYWYPPTYSSIPTYGPSGQVVGNYNYVVPGGVQASNWKLMGLAVRWGRPEDSRAMDSEGR
jgi:hypothetical protein